MTAEQRFKLATYTIALIYDIVVNSDTEEANKIKVIINRGVSHNLLGLDMDREIEEYMKDKDTQP